jgi:hypothetical protein
MGLFPTATVQAPNKGTFPVHFAYSRSAVIPDLRFHGAILRVSDGERACNCLVSALPLNPLPY